MSNLWVSLIIVKFVGVLNYDLTVIAAMSAPTDFYRREVRDRYGRQYQCQFIDDKSTDESRLRMLASSPLHFSMPFNVEKVYLDHGAEDEVVPLWNAEEIYDHLVTQGVYVDYDVRPGLGHDIGSSPEYQAKRNRIFEEFLAR